MIEKLGEFTYAAYANFLKLLQTKYKIITFSEASEAECPHLLLRHDIDASLDAALKMARIESGLNTRSTYFVLFSHKLYNLFEPNSLSILREISELGHEIGLHYDPAAYESHRLDLDDEIHLLEKLLNRRVTSIAHHNLSTLKSDDPFKDTPNHINAYNPCLYDLYVSDSCRAWHIEDLSRLLRLDHEKVQLLIHPIFWTEGVCNRDAVLERLFQRVEKKNEEYKLAWLEAWRRNPRVIEYDIMESYR